MLTIAIASFFALALAGAILTIGMMFHAYQDKIKAVIMAELGDANMAAPAVSQRSSNVVIKPYRANVRRRSFQQVPLRAAA
ncbi:MAG: hypothetical protein ABJP02_11275 [Parasphingorhabdus sp.]|uniref:hypothetical protein n=1 Tax=Parasphingorhabdus sp. TaxID=2709688 RepID=UPI0032972D43